MRAKRALGAAPLAERVGVGRGLRARDSAIPAEAAGVASGREARRVTVKDGRVTCERGVEFEAGAMAVGTSACCGYAVYGARARTVVRSARRQP